MSHPMWVRGLKLYNRRISLLPYKSHPMWVRGLKHYQLNLIEKNITSHPMWVRGLKPGITYVILIFYLVASHVGAWIET